MLDPSPIQSIILFPSITRPHTTLESFEKDIKERVDIINGFVKQFGRAIELTLKMLVSLTIVMIPCRN